MARLPRLSVPGYPHLLVQRSVAGQDGLFRLPQSFAQQRLWFLDQMRPGNPFYNLSTALRLKGRLNAAALEKAINEVVRRHEIMRTSFTMIDGQVMQVIADRFEIQLPIRDLSTLSESARQAEVERLAALDASLPFDLTQAPFVQAIA